MMNPCQLFSPPPPFFTGVIRTALPNMDRETRDQYVLVIQAKDMVGQMGGLSGTTSVTVTLTDVNDNPPRFTHSKSDFCSAANWAHCLHLCVVKSYSALTLSSSSLLHLELFFPA